MKRHWGGRLRIVLMNPSPDQSLYKHLKHSSTHDTRTHHKDASYLWRRKKVTVTEAFMPCVNPWVEIYPLETLEEGEFLMLRNPKNARYLKLKKKAEEIIKRMDGNTSVAQLQATYTEIDVFHLVSTLAKAGFLRDVEAETYRGPLYTVKVPFFDTNTEPFRKLYRGLRVAGSTPFLVVYGAFVLSGFFLFVMHLHTIVESAFSVFHLTVPLRYLLIDLFLFYVVEIAHELAHTGASYNCGAEPGKLGLTFHFLVAFFYVETPNTRILDRRGNISTFMAGPLVSLLAAEVCTYLYLFTDTMPLVWASSSLFWHVSVAVTLSPFMQTDGYYLVQHLVQFPNLFDNTISYAKTRVKGWIRVLGEKEYRTIMAQWNERQKKFLNVYMVFWPVQTMILVYFFFFSVNKAHMLEVFREAPVIFSPENPYGIKGYFLFVSYTWGGVAGALPVVLTVRKYLQRKEG